MMRLKIEKHGEGLHPNEVVVSVNTKDGPVMMVVDPTIIFSDDSVVIGWPVARDPNTSQYLVELPRETEHGSWRVWVPESELRQDEQRKRA
ncbi:hypothetical protein [Bradyrhizobium sp. SZCCHNRI1009]|uniref:hypothetical protein n=1 Tax=Bradyrhizobium sp. SZCCHNRI1009 TaxID=3057277 RepID=UPI002916F03F|nr:hypothetical protein [Bradyrhizobium sp. SZCCHNRI1009]